MFFYLYMLTTWNNMLTTHAQQEAQGSVLTQEADIISFEFSTSARRMRHKRKVLRSMKGNDK